jgi:hypothetical protein
MTTSRPLLVFARSAALLAVFVAVLLAAGGSARADEATRRAAEHFALAESAERREDWATAIAEYKRAHALHPHPSVLYNIARACERIGDWSEAVHHYERYLDEGGDPADRPAVEARIAELRDRAEAARPDPGAGRGTLIVRTSVDGAEVTVDGAPAGRTPVLLEVAAGDRRIGIRLAGYAPVDRVVHVPSGGTEEIRHPLEPTGVPDAPATWHLGIAWGLDVTPAVGMRYALWLGIRSANRRWEANGVLHLAASLGGVGLEARHIVGSADIRPYARAAGIAGRRDGASGWAIEGSLGVQQEIKGARRTASTTAFEYHIELGAAGLLGAASDDADATIGMFFRGAFVWRY